MLSIQKKLVKFHQNTPIIQLTSCHISPHLLLLLLLYLTHLFSIRVHHRIHRYREKEREYDQKQQPHHQYQQHISYQKHSNFNSKYSLDLEHDHALPTSAPNADILKSNSNPTYPNPNRHHNHGHRAHLNSTPSLAGRSFDSLI